MAELPGRRSGSKGLKGTMQMGVLRSTFSKTEIFRSTDFSTVAGMNQDLDKTNQIIKTQGRMRTSMASVSLYPFDRGVK